MMDDFDIFSSVARSASGISAGFLDKVLDGKLTLTDSSSTETWKIIKGVHRVTKTKPRWLPSKKEMTWSVPCQLCQAKSFAANHDGRKLAKNPFSDTASVLGQMYVDRDSATAAHHACLWYAAGQDMIQYEDEDLEGEEHINRFKISSIQQCVTKHKSRKCAFCNLKGACTECANSRCRGRNGWYHLPCGLKNGTVQVNDKSFCGEKHALRERRSIEVAADKRKQRMIEHEHFASLERGDSQSAGVRRNEMSRKVPPKKSESLSSGQQSNPETQKPRSRKLFGLSFLFIKVRKLIPLGSNVDEPSVYLDNAIQDQDTMEDTVTDQSGDELSLCYNISAGLNESTASAQGMDVHSSTARDIVDLEDDLRLSQSRPSSPLSDGVQLENEDIVQEEEVNRSQDSIDVDVNGVNTSLDTLFSLEPFGSSPSQEPMNGSGITDRSFNELVSAGSAECTISELACGSGEGRVIIKADVFNDDLVEKNGSIVSNFERQKDTTKDSPVAFRTSLKEFKTFGEQEYSNPCDNCDIMKDQVKQMKHKFQYAVNSVSFFKGQKKLCKDEIVHLKKKVGILTQQRTDAEREAETFKSESQSLEKRLEEREKKCTDLKRANQMYKKEKDERDDIIEGLRKEINDQARVYDEKDQTIEEHRKRILSLSHSLAQTEEEKTSLKRELISEQNKKPTIDNLIEFLQKKKSEEASNSFVENRGDVRKCFAKKRTSQEPESASKRKRLDIKEA